jgi:deoxyribonuclease-4
MRLGAHVSTREPFSEAVNRAAEIGCECMQIFVNAPQRWAPSVIKDQEIEKFKKENENKKILPVVIHSIYLINLASDNPFYYESSIKSLIDDMQKAERIGAMGVNFHVGSTKGADFEDLLPKVVEAINIILRESPVAPYLLLENSAGSGNIIGDTIEELAQIINSVGSDRLKITLDTAHAFASGYDVRGDGFSDLLEKIDKSIGLKKLACIHLNDSMIEINSKRDRHADIGEGFIGVEAFRNIINHPQLKDIPGIIETPGNKGKSDIDNLAILKGLRI